MYEHSFLDHAPDSKFLNDALEIGKVKADNGTLMEGNNDDLRNGSFDKQKHLLHSEEENGDGFRKLPTLDDLIGVEGLTDVIENRAQDYTNPFIDLPYNDKLSHKGTDLYTDLVGGEDSINSINNDTGDYTNPFIDPPCDLKLFHEADSYTDKSVTECELPELMVCFKEGPYNGIKDICIDEGLPSVDKALIETDEVHGTTLSLVSDEVKLENRFLVQECNNLLEETCNINGDKDQRQSDQVLHFDERDVTLSMASEEKFNLENESLVEESDDSLQEQHNIDVDKDQRHLDQEIDDSRQTVNSLFPSAVEEESNNCNQASELLLKTEMESQIITTNVDSLPTTTDRSQEDEIIQKDIEALKALMKSTLEEDIQDNRTASSRSFLNQQGYGESSFSSVGPLSGPISYSGAIPFSGSISLRSDSSTTSARSFAFPVLNTEWRSSPVKMVKAERSQLWKHRMWRLCCCRF